MKDVKIDIDKNFYCIGELKIHFYFDEDFDGYVLESAEIFSMKVQNQTGVKFL